MREAIRFGLVLSLLNILLNVAVASVSSAEIRTELLEPGFTSKSTLTEQDRVRLKLKNPAFVERIFVAANFKSQHANVQVIVNGRVRAEIATPLRASDLEINIGESTTSIEFLGIRGTTELQGVIVVISNDTIQSAPVAPVRVTPVGRPSDVLKLMNKAKRDLDNYADYLQPEDIASFVAPAQNAAQDVIIKARAGLPYSDVIPVIRVLKEKLQKLAPLVNRSRNVMNRNERELANSISIWSLEVQSLAD